MNLNPALKPTHNVAMKYISHERNKNSRGTQNQRSSTAGVHCVAASRKSLAVFLLATTFPSVDYNPQSHHVLMYSQLWAETAEEKIYGTKSAADSHGPSYKKGDVKSISV